MIHPYVGRNLYGHLQEADREFTDWLYGEYNEDKLRQFEMLHNIPFLGDYMDYKLDLRADREYLARYGMSYSDIHDPRKLKEVGSGSRMYSSGFQFISKNVGRLYR